MLIIAIFGLSGSGKTTLAENLVTHYKNTHPSLTVGIVSQDNFYHDYSSCTPEQRDKINFDSPAAINFDALYQALKDLKQGKSFVMSYYDQTTYRFVKEKAQLFLPKELVIVEGHLLMSHPELQRLFDFNIYMDIDPAQSLWQRMCREVKKNKLITEYTLHEYSLKIAPMAEAHILPYKKKANVLFDYTTPFLFQSVINCIDIKLAIQSHRFQLFTHSSADRFKSNESKLESKLPLISDSLPPRLSS